MGTTIREYYSNAFPNDYFGFVTGSASILRFPDQPAKLAKFVAYAANIGSFFIDRYGSAVSVFEIDGGVTTEWFAVKGENLQSYQYRNPSGSSDFMAYWVQF